MALDLTRIPPPKSCSSLIWNSFNTSQEYGRPTSKKDWGWCRDTCNKDPGLAERLQETKLDILNPDECEDFDPVMQPNATHEICTGRKNPFPTVWLFKRTKSLETGRFSFKHIGKEKNYLGFKKSKHDFYLGGTDSCQGNYEFDFVKVGPQIWKKAH